MVSFVFIGKEVSEKLSWAEVCFVALLSIGSFCYFCSTVLAAQVVWLAVSPTSGKTI